MSPRANPLPPDERRAELIAATVPLLERHGTRVSTAQIAEAAGVAEGTIFRVFASKQELVEASVHSVMDPEPDIARLDAMDLNTNLDARLLQLVELFNSRTRQISALTFALYTSDPQHRHPHHSVDKDPRVQNARVNEAVARVLAPDADRFSVPLLQAASLLRGLAVVTAHPLLGDDSIRDPHQIVQLFLHGVLQEESC